LSRTTFQETLHLTCRTVR